MFNRGPSKPKKPKEKAWLVTKDYKWVKVYDDHVTIDKLSYPIADAVARLESEGDLERRITATRIATLGVFALAVKKKTDHRRLFLTLDGPTFQAILEIKFDEKDRARKFVSEFNTLARAVVTS